MSARLGATLTVRPLTLFAIFASMGAGVVLGMSAFLATSYRQAPNEGLLLSVLRQVGEQYVDDVPRSQLVDNAIRGALAGLDDHSVLLDEAAMRDLQQRSSGRFGGVGVEVAMVDGYITVVSAFADAPAARAGLKAGDRLIAVDHATLKGRTLTDAVADLRGQPGTDVHLRVRRSDVAAPLDFDVTRATVEAPSVVGRLLAPGYGYVRIVRFNDATADGLADTVVHFAESGALQGMVVDLRANPGGLLRAAVAVADAFLDEGLIVYTEGRSGTVAQRFEATPGDILNGAPLAVLIDGGSASAAEVVAGALKDHARATLLGSKSFGKGSVQALMHFRQRRAIKLTTARYFTPAGGAIDAVGIAPQIAVAAEEGERRRDYNQRLIARALSHLKQQTQKASALAAS